MHKFTNTVITVTLSPALDSTVLLESEGIGEADGTYYGTKTDSRPGGKGINVSRTLCSLGVATRAVAVLGGAVGDRISEELSAEGIPLDVIATFGETRENITYRYPSGAMFEVNGRARVPEGDRLASAAVRAARLKAGDILVIGGSLPIGVTHKTVSALLGHAAESGAYSVLDSSGAQLRAALGSACPPDLIKPNLRELSDMLGTDVTADRAAELCDRFTEGRRTTILCTAGEYGAVYSEGGRHVTVPAERLAPESVVRMKGAGDTYLAAFLANVGEVGERMKFANEVTRDYLISLKR